MGQKHRGKIISSQLYDGKFYSQTLHRTPYGTGCLANPRLVC